MSANFTRNNLVGTHIYPITDLGHKKNVGNNESVSGTVFETIYPATLLIVTKLASGAATLKVDIADTDANINYSSPTATTALSGTGFQVTVVDTTANYTTGASELKVGVQVVGGGSGCEFDKFAVIKLYELEPGEDWYSIKMAGMNAVGNTTLGDGSGVLDLTANTDAAKEPGRVE